MTIEKKTERYEILVRFEQGQVKAAHIKNLEKIVEGGEIISARESVAEPISIEDVIKVLEG